VGQIYFGVDEAKWVKIQLALTVEIVVRAKPAFEAVGVFTLQVVNDDCHNV
jgi:hypothetical protein